MTKSQETKSKYQGVFVAACTPMKEDFSLDLPRIRTCIEYLVSGGLRTGTAVCVALEEVYNRALAEVLREGTTGEGNFIKACMPLVGIPCGPARLPLRHPPAWFADRVRRMIDSVGELRLAAS